MSEKAGGINGPFGRRMQGAEAAAAIAAGLDPRRTVLIAGPTASGKSALALALAERTGRAVVNADALQVYADWRILTARPAPGEEARAPHLLYGHVPGERAHSVGDWLRDLRALAVLSCVPAPVIVGGTGLFFAALTGGLAEIPETPPEVRAAAEARLAGGLAGLVADLDPATRARLDPANPRRVQRAWEVLRTTGRGLADWQARTPPPDLALADTLPLLLAAGTDRLAPRIAARVDAMLAGGLLDEAEANRPGWSAARPSARAIGAADLMAHLAGEITREALRERLIVATRQYAKRQRTWFRARMAGWHPVDAG